MSTFRDDLADVIHDDFDFANPWATWRQIEQRCADAILAMPEMQAIRKALVRLAPCAWHVEMRGETGSKLARNRMIAALEGLDVPRSVIDWVLEDQ